jgi:chemotaxis protein MotB
MVRRKIEAEPENHERWLVSYADFITLLFAFFVVMFASSQTDRAKARAVSDSMARAFEGGLPVKKITDAFRGKTDGKRVGSQNDGKFDPTIIGVPEENNLKQSSAALVLALEKEIEAGKISISMESRGLVISLRQAAFFPSGGDVLLADAVPSLDKIANVIKKLPNQIRLEGHTDSLPISNTRFRNNWELSSARGIAVLQRLESNYSFPKSKLAVVAYAETVPKVSNDSEEGRALNRRVDITILNERAARNEAHTNSGPKNAAIEPEPTTR